MEKTYIYEINRRSQGNKKINDKNTAIEKFIKDQKALGNDISKNEI